MPKELDVVKIVWETAQPGDKQLNNKDKTPYHHGDLRNSMLAAADVILAKDGLQALTLRACARAAGVSHAAPSHHFGDLRGLLTALAADSFQQLGDVAEEVRTTCRETPRKAFGSLGLAYANFARTNPDRFRLMFRRDLVNYEDETFRNASRRCFAAMTNIIALTRGSPEATLEDLASEHRPGLARDVVMTWSLIHGFAHLRTEGSFDPFAAHMGGENFDREAWDWIGETVGALLDGKEA